MNMSADGKLTPRMKIRGKKRVIKEIVQMMEKHAQDGVNYSGNVLSPIQLALTMRRR